MRSIHSAPFYPERDDSKKLRFGSGFLFGAASGFLFWSALMAMAFLAMSYFGPSLLTAATAPQEVQEQVPQRPVGVIRKDVMAFVKNSKSDDVDLQIGGALDLCRVHQEIVNDPRFMDNEQLKGFRAIAGKRLKNYLKELDIKKRRTDRELARLKGKSSKKNKTEQKETPKDSDGNPYEDVEMLEDRFLNDSMLGSMQSISQFSGGPANMFGYIRGNFGGAPWNDQALINLIQTTINPDHWRINGGDGAIIWYDPVKALIITGSQESHDKISDLLNQMRDLSR